MAFNKNFFDVFRAAQTAGEPVACYIKTILGKVDVEVLDPFTGNFQIVHLKGDPNSADRDDVTVTLWTDMEHEYFRRANKVLLQRGYLAPYTQETIKQISVNEVTDEELLDALNKKFFAVAALLNKFTSPLPVQRLLKLAEDNNKPVRTIEVIKERLSELQKGE